mmetsp:Transcript_114173/g.328032  ORF Transcript_114173/g.328032 Transcript_114173/m.328032 type:complete len:294 (+) Transcript_114173:937-1818(+)
MPAEVPKVMYTRPACTARRRPDAQAPCQPDGHRNDVGAACETGGKVDGRRAVEDCAGRRREGDGCADNGDEERATDGTSLRKQCELFAQQCQHERESRGKEQHANVWRRSGNMNGSPLLPRRLGHALQQAGDGWQNPDEQGGLTSVEPPRRHRPHRGKRQSPKGQGCEGLQRKHVARVRVSAESRLLHGGYCRAKADQRGATHEPGGNDGWPIDATAMNPAATVAAILAVFSRRCVRVNAMVSSKSCSSADETQCRLGQLRREKQVVGVPSPPQHRHDEDGDQHAPSAHLTAS